MALTTNDNDKPVTERAAEIAELSRQAEIETILMGLEGTTLALNAANAKFRMIADHLNINLDNPVFNDMETQVNEDMLKSIAERVLKLGQLSARIKGEPVPEGSGNVADIIGTVLAEAQAQYGTQENSKAPTLEPAATSGKYTCPNDIEEKSLTVNNVIDPSILDAIRDPTSNAYKKLMAEVYSDENWSDDTTADEDTAAYNGQSDARLEDGTAIEFKSVRNPCGEIEAEGTGGVLPNPISELRVEVFKDFPKTNFRDDEDRYRMMGYIIDFYVTQAIDAYDKGLLTEDEALRLAQEFHMVPEEEISSPEIVFPSPGTIAQDIPSRAADDELVTTYLVSDTAEVMEALIASYMTTLAFFNSRTSAAFLEDRLREIGMGT